MTARVVRVILAHMPSLVPLPVCLLANQLKLRMLFLFLTSAPRSCQYVNFSLPLPLPLSTISISAELWNENERWHARMGEYENMRTTCECVHFEQFKWKLQG